MKRNKLNILPFLFLCFCRWKQLLILEEVLILEFMSWDWNSKQSKKTIFSRYFVDHTWPVNSRYFARKITNNSSQPTPKVRLFWYRNQNSTGACLYLWWNTVFHFRKDCSVRIFCIRKEYNVTFSKSNRSLEEKTNCFIFTAAHLLF